LHNRQCELHTTVVNNVNPASVVNFLFQESVIGADDMRALQTLRDDRQRQCSELLAMLLRQKTRRLSSSCTLPWRRSHSSPGWLTGLTTSIVSRWSVHCNSWTLANQ